MNRESVNNRLSQLPIQMAGIINARMADGISLSIFEHTVIPIAK
ncbi:hypothetical protein [Cohnella sp. REN36]|nr:hypothetical protein [Cohnella sp. REN36]